METLFLNRKHKSISISICECGYEKCLPTHKVGPVKRQYYLIHFVVDGKGYYNADKHYELGKCDAFIINPGETISYGPNADDPWTYYWLGFDSPKIKPIIEELFNNSYVFKLENENYIKSLFLEISKSDYNNEATQFLVISKLYELLYHLFIVNNLKVSEFRDDVISEVTSYIDDHIKEELSVQSIADHFGFSRSRLFVLFKEKMGISIKEYISNSKLDRSWTLLETNHNLTVQEVGFLVGFSNYQTFLKAFKKKFYINPSELKNR